MKESQLVYAVMQELGKHGAVYRCNSGSVALPNGKRFNGMPKGFADVMLIRADGMQFAQVSRASLAGLSGSGGNANLAI
jgi:hypothetical protein